MNITITLSNPTLVGGEKFKTRHRLYPSGTFSAYTDRTNAPFTITGLTAGQYELEVIFVTELGDECDAIYEYFNVYNIGDCPTFTLSLECNNFVPYLNMDYTFPSPYTMPGCGYRVTVVQATGTIVKDYPTGLSITGNEKIILSSVSGGVTVKIEANNCGIFTECEYLSLAPLDCDCTPLVVSSAYMQYNPSIMKWKVTINYTNSTPATSFTRISYNQVNTVFSGSLDSGVINTLSPLPTSSIAFYVNANINGAFEAPTYHGVIIDQCGNSIPWATP